MEEQNSIVEETEVEPVNLSLKDGDKPFKLLVSRFDVFFVSAVIIIFIAGVVSLWVIAETDKTLSQTEQATEESTSTVNTSNQ